MSSLTLKLTLAFFAVGIMGAVLVAVLVGLRTRSEFDRFLSDHDQAILLQALEDYYAAHGSWEGVKDILARDRRLDFYSSQVALVDSQHTVVLGHDNLTAGQRA